MVRRDVQQLATDVHEALGLEGPSLPPTPLLPPTGALHHLALPCKMPPVFCLGAKQLLSNGLPAALHVLLTTSLA